MLSIYLSIYRHTPTFLVIVSLRSHTRVVYRIIIIIIII